MIKRVLLAAVAVLALTLFAGVGAAGAQTEESCNPNPSVVPDPPSSPACTTTSVLSEEVTTTTAQVLGETVTRPLPRTGGDIALPTFVGLGLTGAGVVLAVGARRRRNQHQGAA